MIKSKRNKKSGKKRLTFKAILQMIGIAVVSIVLLVATAERILHYFHHHLTK